MSDSTDRDALAFGLQLTVALMHAAFDELEAAFAAVGYQGGEQK